MAPESQRAEAIVAVRSIRAISQSLYAVTLRLDTGETRTLVIDRQLATIESVKMAAHVVAVLTKTRRI